MKSAIKTAPWVASALLALGCAGTSSDQRAQMSGALDEVQSREYAGSETCLSVQEYDTMEILDEQHLLFEDATGSDVWLNELRQRCPGLRPHDVLAFEMNGNRLCDLDTAEVVHRTLFWRSTGPRCTLGEFHELTEAQAALVKDALSAR